MPSVPNYGDFLKAIEKLPQENNLESLHLPLNADRSLQTAKGRDIIKQLNSLVMISNFSYDFTEENRFKIFDVFLQHWKKVE